jgi:hypothetical protein
MTAWLLLAAVRRQWRVALLGLLLTFLALGWATTVRGVYYSQVYVVLLSPVSADQPNVYQSIGRSLVGAAGIVVRQVDPAALDPAPVSPDVTIVDRGITQGYRVRIPNLGGQWTYNFERAELNVEAAGSSPEEVKRTLREVVTTIQTALEEDQVRAGASRNLMIGTTLNPPDPPVFYSHGSRTRALAAVLTLGLGLTLAGVVGWDRRAARRLARASGRSSAQGDGTEEAFPVLLSPTRG